jgi:inhibitor of KinA
VTPGAGKAASCEVVRIAAAGDAALLLEFPARIDPRVNACATQLAAALRQRGGGAIRDAVVGYHTVTVYFDPMTADARWIESEMRAAAAELEDVAVPEAPAIDVPVCYGGDLGPDLADVARFGRCSPQDVIGIHSERTYRVYMIGFVPGFTYMAEVDARIAAPRRMTPRPMVPAGAVGIAAGQTGIYPAVTPGGWNIIGRTPLRPYDPGRANPFLFRAGDRVRFRPIPREEFGSA